MRAIIILSFLLICLGCSPSEKDRNNPKPLESDIIVTSFYPTTYFAERISGGLVPVVCLLPEDEDPIYWKPSSDAIVQFQAASLVILNGAEFEKWPNFVSLPLSKTIESVNLPPEELVKYEDSISHRHGPSGEHSHEGIDGHTWLDPVMAKLQSKTILEGMKRIWPLHGEAFEQNFNLLSADLDELNNRFESFQNVKLLASHPAYNYLSKRYGWDIINFDFDPAEPLDENQIKSLELALKKSARSIMLWEQMPLDAVKKNLKEKFSINNIHFSPCESIAASDLAKGLDYLKMMNINLDKLESVYQKNE
tara:strand:+ start:723 stop:1646 length:924 start_codon:yes stop_codon:yes gene_type:complete